MASGTTEPTLTWILVWVQECFGCDFYRDLADRCRICTRSRIAAFSRGLLTSAVQHQHNKFTDLTSGIRTGLPGPGPSYEEETICTCICFLWLRQDRARSSAASGALRGVNLNGAAICPPALGARLGTRGCSLRRGVAPASTGPHKGASEGEETTTARPTEARRDRGASRDQRDSDRPAWE